MKKFKLQSDEQHKQPTKEEISKYKDFGKLVTNYEKAKERIHKPLYKDPKAFLFLVVLLLILYLVLQASQNTPPQDQPQDPPVEQKP